MHVDSRPPPPPPVQPSLHRRGGSPGRPLNLWHSAHCHSPAERYSGYFKLNRTYDAHM